MEGENISFGSKIAQSIIMDLFVDDGVSSREHRDSLMQSDFKFTGISFCPHVGRYKYMTDFLYAGSYSLYNDGYKKIDKLVALRKKPIVKAKAPVKVNPEMLLANKFERDIFDAQNRLRTNPKSFTSQVKGNMSNFEGKL